MKKEFITNRALMIEKAVPPQLCEDTLCRIEKEYDFHRSESDGKVDSNYRDSTEVRIKDKKIIEGFWTHIKNYVPSMCDGEKLVGLHKTRVYMFRYYEDGFFRKHYDGFSEDKKGNRSRITVLVYLNDLDETCGGATRFYSESSRDINFVNHDGSIFDIVPRIGTMVMFTHNLLHEEMPLLKGYKYCIRFNVLYTNSQKNLCLNTNDNNGAEPERKKRSIDGSSSLGSTSFSTSSSSNYQNTIYPNPLRDSPVKFTDSPYEFDKFNQSMINDEYTKPYAESSKQAKINEAGVSNGLKYKKVYQVINGKNMFLSPVLTNPDSKERWSDVCHLPHVFNIKKLEFPGFIDTTMGRPPSWDEDFCPNCYEILSLYVKYEECPSCSAKVESIDGERRRHIFLNNKP